MDAKATAGDNGPQPPPVVLEAAGLGVDGEHGPLFAGVDLTLTEGLHAIQLPGGPGQSALLLALSGRLKPTHGTVRVLGADTPRAIRQHCSIAAFDDIDELEDSVTVQTVLAEQSRWLAPWYRKVPIEAGRDTLDMIFGDIPAPPAKRYIMDLTDLELFLLRISLAVLSSKPIVVIGDLEQVRDNNERALAVGRLGALADKQTVIVGVTNPLGDTAPVHALHDHRILIERI